MNKIWLLICVSILLTGCGGGPQFDGSYRESSELAQEFAEGKAEAEKYKDSYTEYLMSQRKPEYDEDRIDEIAREAGWDTDTNFSQSGSNSGGCQYGCDFHKGGCDIKGNISIETGEKIYHMPWQEWYDETNISPKYGERWFCTEAEAKANGWRKAKN